MSFDYTDKEQLRGMIQESVRRNVNQERIAINEDVSELSLNEQKQIQESVSDWIDSVKDWINKRKLKGLGIKVLQSQSKQERYFFVRNDQSRDYVALKYDGNRFEDKIEFSSIGELENFVNDLEEQGYELLKRKGKIRDSVRSIFRSFGVINLFNFGISIVLITVLLALGFISVGFGSILGGIVVAGELVPGWLMVRYTGEYPEEPEDRPKDNV